MTKRTMLFCILLVGLCYSTVSGLNFIGPPRAVLDGGKFGTYFSYSKSKIEIDVSGTAPDIDGSTIEQPDKIEIDRYDTAAAWGIFNNWEVFVQFGGLKNNTELDASGIGTIEAKSDTILSWGIGTRVTVFKSNGFSLGGTCQMNWMQNIEFDTSVDRDDDTWEHVLEAELDMTEIQIAAGPSWYLANVFSVYGGPFVHFITGEYSHEEMNSTLPSVVYKDTSDLEEETIWGGYAGASAELFNIVALFVEWQYTADADAWAAGLLLSF